MKSKKERARKTKRNMGKKGEESTGGGRIGMGAEKGDDC